MHPPAPLPSPIRYVASTDLNTGLSSISIQKPLDMAPVRPGAPTLAGSVWITQQTPANLTRNVDGATLTKPGIVQPNGTVVSMLDFPPGASSPLHYTSSIDYMVVLNGTITMELSDGSFTEIKAGEVVVMKGAAHAWHNRTKE